MLGVFHAGPERFRSGWFVESLATQTLVVFAIRTRRVPFFHSRASRPLILSVLGVVVVGTALPGSPLGPVLGFEPLPVGFFAVLVAMVVAYLGLIEAGKHIFYRVTTTGSTRRRDSATRRLRHVRRRVGRFSTRKPPGGAATHPVGGG